MESKKKLESRVKVTIAGEEYTIRSDASPEYTRATATHVDDMMRELLASTGVVESHKAALLVALQLADDLFQARLTARPMLGKSTCETIIRRLDFPEPYTHAAVSLLSYFAEVLRHKYPDEPVSVSITQSGLAVTLLVETREGLRDEVVSTLSDFEDVVNGVASPVVLFSNPLHIAALQQKLDVARAELRGAERLFALQGTQYEARIDQLEDTVFSLKQLMAGQMRQNETLAGVFARVLGSDRYEVAVREAIDLLKTVLTDGVIVARRGEVEGALQLLHSQRPNVLARINDFCLQATSGATGQILANWIAGLR